MEDPEEKDDEAFLQGLPVPSACIYCKKNPVAYECVPCGCPSACKACAMRLASGGRCKCCGQFFGGMRRLR